MEHEYPELQKLLSDRGRQAPTDEYVEEFLDEFHRRQREDFMKRSARSLFMERLSVWFREMGAAKWAYAVGGAYALLMVGFVLWPRPQAAEGILPGDRSLQGATQEERRVPDSPLVDDRAGGESTEF